MAKSEELPIYRDTLDLLDRLLMLTKNFPRFYRYGMGQRMVDLNIEMLALVYKANRSYEKLGPISELADNLHMLQMLFRLSVRHHVITERQYASVVGFIDRIGRQCTGWRRHYERPPSAPQPAGVPPV